MVKLRILVVDDAVVMRRLISEAIASDPELEVAGIAANGKIALARIPQLNPDAVTLDVEMPELDGVATVVEIRKLYPKLPVIMFSTLTKRGAETTLDALGKGANDYVTKPSNVGDVREGIKRLQEELIPRIKLHCRPNRPVAPVEIRPRISPRAAEPSAIEAIVIGTSTGGPNALAEIFSHWKITSSTPPVFIVQHMPPVFTELLADRLRKVSGAEVHEAIHDQRVESGRVYIAPGGYHLEVRRRGTQIHTLLQQEPPENSCRPAVDVLFRSASATYGASALGVVLTGMGQDGLRGCTHLREAGARIVAQDAATSVVWGMPGAVVSAGLADHVVPLSGVSSLLPRLLSRNAVNQPALS